MSRLKAIYRGWAIPCAGEQVYAPRYRAEWLAKISEAGVRRRAELYYVQFDTLAALRQGVRRELLAESRKHPATKLRRQIPPDRPHPRRSVGRTDPDAQPLSHQASAVGLLWHVTEDLLQWGYRLVSGELKRSKKVLAVRGLNLNQNHDLKNIFKGAATRAAATAGPLQDLCEARVGKGVKPHLARLTLARCSTTTRSCCLLTAPVKL